MWTSLNQQVKPPAGDGVTGITYPTAGEEAVLWTLDIDAGVTHNPFSVKLNDKDGNWLPMFIDPVFMAYGAGPISFGGTGLPKAGGNAFKLQAIGATPNTAGLLLISAEMTDIPFKNGVVLYVNTPFLVIFNMYFDGTGSFVLPAAIPSGMFGIDLFMQTFSLTGPPEHSNGLRMTVIP
jgi:hypothetical protein